MAVQLLSLHFLVGAMATSEFAVYSIAIAMMPWLALGDIGMGSALQNFAVESRVAGQNSRPEFNAVLSLSAIVLCLGGLALMLMAPFVGPFLFNGHGMTSAGSTTIFLVASSVFLISGIGAISTRILYGMGNGHLANVLLAFSSIVSLASLIASIQLLQSDQLVLAAVLAYALPPAVVNIGALVVLARRHADLKLRFVRSDCVRVWKRARGFFIASFFATAVLNVDYFIMARTLTATNIAIYAVLARCLGIFISLYGGMLSASGVYWLEKWTANDLNAVRRSIFQHIAVGALATTILTTLIFIVVFYLKSRATSPIVALLPYSTIFIFGLYTLIRIWNDTFALAMQALNETGILMRVMPLQATVSVVSQIALSLAFGLNGIILGLMVSFLTTSSWLLPRHFFRISNP